VDTARGRDPQGVIGRARARLDAWQRRHAVAAVSVAVVRKFLDDRATNLAALIAYYGFFSLFPLLLVLVSVLGFVLDGNPELRADVVDSTLARIPVIGPQLDDELEPLTGSTPALVLGLIGALWAGLGVTVALGRAFERVWDVPRIEERSMVRARLRGLAMLATLAVGLVAATALTGLALWGKVGPFAEQAGAFGTAIAVNLGAFLILFALLTERPLRLRELLPGAAVAAAGMLLLQAAGTWYVDAAVARATATYGTFALVIGLLSWFLLAAYLVLLAAELNVVLCRRLWPRSLGGELTDADRAALRRHARAARQDERQEIVVRFGDLDPAAPTAEDEPDHISDREPPS
jgi:YihY family inner membrane protein